jgi:hypothetical protein
MSFDHALLAYAAPHGTIDGDHRGSLEEKQGTRPADAAHLGRDSSAMAR